MIALGISILMVSGLASISPLFWSARRSRELLTESRRRYAQASKLVRFGHWDHDAITGEVILSEETYRILGIAPGSASHQIDPILNLLHPSDRQMYREAIQGALRKEGSTEIEFRIVGPDGGVRSISAVTERKVDTDGSVVGLSGSLQDVTEIRLAEEEHRAGVARVHRQQEWIVKLSTSRAVSEGHLEKAAQEITEAAADAIVVERVSIWMFDEDQTELNCVDLFQRSTARHSAEATQYTENTPEYFRAIYSDRAVDAHDARSDPRTREFRDDYLIPLGIYSMLDAAIRVSGKTVGVVCVEQVGSMRTWTADESTFVGELSDQFAQAILNHQRREFISALQKAHDELEDRVAHRTSELRSIVRGLPDLYFRMNKDGTILDYHAPDPGLLYADPEAFIGERIQDVLPEPAATLVQQALATVLETGQPQTIEYALSIEDEDQYFEARLIPVIEEQVAAIVRDMTERHTAAESLRRSERLASIGTLAAGIAHEINNPLGTILLSAETAQQLSDNPEDQRLLADCLSRIKGDVRRASRIVKSVLQFSRQEEESQRHRRSLREILERAQMNVEEDALKKLVDIELRVPENLPHALMNPTEMEQVFVNLLANAIEACPMDGQISVSAIVEGDVVRVSVHDDGPGISPDDQVQVFDPFFTTRRNAGGTGLGLSLSLGIVQQHGGSMDVESKAGAGTTFSVLLPLNMVTAERTA